MSVRSIRKARSSRRITARTWSGLLTVTVSRAPRAMSSPTIVLSIWSRQTTMGTAAAMESRTEAISTSSCTVGPNDTSNSGLSCSRASAISCTAGIQVQCTARPLLRSKLLSVSTGSRDALCTRTGTALESLKQCSTAGGRGAPANQENTSIMTGRRRAPCRGLGRWQPNSDVVIIRGPLKWPGCTAHGREPTCRAIPPAKSDRV